MKNMSPTKLLLALFLLVAGIVLLLNNLGIVPLGINNIFRFVYPFAILIVGLFWFLQGLDRKSNSKIFWGLFVTVFSGLLIADRFGLVTFGFWDFFKLWPLILLYFAYQLLFNRKKSLITFTIDTSDMKEEMDSFRSVDDFVYRSKSTDSNKKDVHMGSIDIDEILEVIEEQVDNEEIWKIIHEHVRQILHKNLNSEKIHEIIRDNMVQYNYEDNFHQTFAKNSKDQYNDEGAHHSSHQDSHENNQHQRYTGNESKTDSNEWSETFSEKRKFSSSDSTSVNVLGMSVGDIRYNSPGWLLEPLKLNYTIANVFMDFSKAFIPEGETPVVINGKIGDVEILIPEEIPVRVKVKNSIGNVAIFEKDFTGVRSGSSYFYESENYQEATRKISLDIKISVGSVEIEKV